MIQTILGTVVHPLLIFNSSSDFFDFRDLKRAVFDVYFGLWEEFQMDGVDRNTSEGRSLHILTYG